MSVLTLKGEGLDPFSKTAKDHKDTSGEGEL